MEDGADELRGFLEQGKRERRKGGAWGKGCQGNRGRKIK